MRDEAAEERIALVANPDGCFGCHFAASCSTACPEAVDPAGAIQRLRSIAIRTSLGLWRRRASEAAPPLEKPLRRVDSYPTGNLVEGADPEELRPRGAEFVVPGVLSIRETRSKE